MWWELLIGVAKSSSTVTPTTQYAHPAPVKPWPDLSTGAKVGLGVGAAAFLGLLVIALKD